jgi:hypothetical protein
MPAALVALATRGALKEITDLLDLTVRGGCRLPQGPGTQ